MHTKQTIAVIGASSSMGAVIAKKLARGNYKLLLYYNEGDNKEPLLQEIKRACPAADVEAVACTVNACWEADFILMDLPFEKEQELAEKIRTVANQKIVISMAQAFYDSSRSRLRSSDNTAATALQSMLPNSKLVKVFTSSANSNLATACAGEAEIFTVLSGNDKEALQTVFGLFSISGLNPVVAGSLAERPMEQLV